MHNEKTTGINATNSEYPDLLPLWEEIRAIIKGKRALVDLKSRMPLPEYTDTVVGTTTLDTAVIDRRVRNYLLRGRLLNATAQTLNAFTGMVWSKDPEIELPSKLEFMRDKLREDLQKIVNTCIPLGRFGVMLDAEEIGRTPTIAEQEKGVGVPKWVLYEPEQIRYCRDDEVRLSECYEEKISGLDYVEKKQIRRLVMIDGVYHNQIWREDELYDDVIPTASGAPLDYIPFQFFGSDNNDSSFDKPPMYDLAEFNIGHFLLDCDNRDNLHWNSQGSTNVFIADADEFSLANPNGLNTGAKGVNQFGVNDRAEIMQIASTGACAAEMLRDEQRLIMLGAQLVQDTSSNQTLGAKRIEYASSTSVLKRIVRNVSHGATQLLKWQAEIVGANPEEVKCHVNDEFMTDEMTPEKLTAHLALVQSGSLPKETLFESARKAGLTKMDNEEIEQALGEQAFSVGGTGYNEALAAAQSEAE